MKRILMVMIAVLVAFSGISCNKGGDEARDRVTKKKDITETVVERKVDLQQIDMAKIPADPAELQKVLTMNAEERAARLNSYRLTSQTTYRIKRDGKDVNLDESHEYEKAENGDFRLAILNDKAKTFEMYWVDGKIIDRTSSPKFRVSTSAGKHLFWREKTLNSLTRFFKYFRGHLAFKDGGIVDYEGRKARKVVFALDPKGKTPKKDLTVKFSFPSQYRLSAKASEKLLNKQRKAIDSFDEATGEVLIDIETAVPVKFTFESKYTMMAKVPEKKPEGEEEKAEPASGKVSFAFSSSMAMKNIGDDIEITAPEYEPPMQRNRPDPKALDHLPKGSKVHQPPPGTNLKAEPLPEGMKTGTKKK